MVYREYHYYGIAQDIPEHSTTPNAHKSFTQALQDGFQGWKQLFKEKPYQEIKADNVNDALAIAVKEMHNLNRKYPNTIGWFTKTIILTDDQDQVITCQTIYKS
jgi:hypothetical protein